MTSLLWFYGIFGGALGLGLGLRRWQAAAPGLMRFSILALDTPLFIYSYWSVDLARARLYAPIPIIATLLVVLTLWLSPLWAKRLLPDERSQGSFILTAAFSNIGTTGGAFLCYLFFGLEGLSLAYLFLLPYPILIFTLGFNTARRYSGSGPLRPHEYLTRLASDLISLVPLLAIALGLGLNVAGLKPPAALATGVGWFMKVSLACNCLAIGLTLSPRELIPPVKAFLAEASIKFLLSPLAGLILALAVYGSLAPLPSRIILIQSAMPPAMYAVITTNLFGLDRKLANSLWLALSLGFLPLAALGWLLR
ncbi:MAG: AEC family transporter [candidate division FCPU426 bacterium]